MRSGLGAWRQVGVVPLAATFLPRGRGWIKKEILACRTGCGRASDRALLRPRFGQEADRRDLTADGIVPLFVGRSILSGWVHRRQLGSWCLSLPSSREISRE